MSAAGRRVLSLSTLYPNPVNPRFGTFVARQMEALAARGDWDVTVINPIGIPPLALGRYRQLLSACVDGVENGVSLHRPRFTLIPKLGARRNPQAIAGAVLPLAERLHAAKPFDLVDAQFFYPDGPAAARVADALGLPLSIKARGADIHYWGARSWARQAMLAAARQADGLLAVSQALAEDMVALGMRREKISVHYTGLDRDRFRPLQHPGLRRQLAGELGLSLADDAPLLASVGALIPRKGQDLVFAALHELPQAQLLLVGRGEDEPRLRRLAQRIGVAERVHFLGAVDHDLLPLILSAADAMVLPSASEGLANAWVEALACGTPIVICDAGGAREIVTGPAAGRIVERRPDALAAAVAETLASPPSPATVAGHAARFSWESNAAGLASHYEKIAR